jgi:small-conductance mechanosensitive channel
MAESRRQVLLAFGQNLGLSILVGGLFVVLYVLTDRSPLPAVLASQRAILLLVVAASGIVIVGFLFARTLGSAIQALALVDRNYARVNTIRLFVNLLVAVVVVLGLTSLFGASFTSIIFGSTFIVIVLGLAAQTILSNVFGGLTILVAKPFRTGDHVALVSSSYGAIWPSYPHELEYPTYEGTIRELGLFYTVIRLENGQIARIPNGVVVQALVVNFTQTPLRSQRVRFTAPSSLSLAEVEAAVEELLRSQALTPRDAPAPSVQVADVTATTWDAVVVIWTDDPRDEVVRDRVLRAILPRLAPKAAPRA